MATASLIVAIVGTLAAIAAVLWAIFERHERIKERDERDAKDAREAEQRREAAAQRERVQAAFEAPRIVVERGSVRSNDGPTGWMSVGLRISNKGPTVASDVRFGVAVGDWRGAASKPGTDTQVLHALGNDETVDDWRVRVPHAVVAGQLANNGQRLADAISALWVEYRDQRDESHTREFSPD